jgi:predicted metal-dependent enzyme (double-stranded beta helix superfamily)
LAAWAARFRQALEEAPAGQLDDVLLASSHELLRDFDPSGGGEPRGGRHTDRTWWLYYDGELSVIAATMSAGAVVEPHSHGNWNVTGVYRGAVQYVGYRRTDDASHANVADLEVASRCILRAGEAALCPPAPADIHEVVCLEDGTVTVLVAAPFDDVRDYFMPDRHLYVRRGGAPTSVVPDLRGA